jgi:hypothetical protein
MWLVTLQEEWWTQRANADIERAADPDHRDEDVVWVTAGDAYANRTVTIAAPVRAGLVDATDTLIQTASDAMSAAACLDRGAQDRPMGPGQEPAVPRSRRPEGPARTAQEVRRVARP